MHVGEGSICEISKPFQYCYELRTQIMKSSIKTDKTKASFWLLCCFFYFYLFIYVLLITLHYVTLLHRLWDAPTPPCALPHGEFLYLAAVLQFKFNQDSFFANMYQVLKCVLNMRQ